jgi:hypothetical protein
MGVCASSGGFYRSYHVMQGIDEIVPVDVYVPGCPPSPEGLLAALMRIQERIQNGEQTQAPQGQLRLGTGGDGANDRRARRSAWAREDAQRAAKGLPAQGVIDFDGRRRGAASVVPAVPAAPTGSESESDER